MNDPGNHELELLRRVQFYLLGTNCSHRQKVKLYGAAFSVKRNVTIMSGLAMATVSMELNTGITCIS